MSPTYSPRQRFSRRRPAGEPIRHAAAGASRPEQQDAGICECGHVPGFLLNQAGDTEAVLESTGVPLGLFSGAVFSTRKFLLDVRHVVVLSTDGATETTTATMLNSNTSGGSIRSGRTSATARTRSLKASTTL